MILLIQFTVKVSVCVSYTWLLIFYLRPQWILSLFVDIVWFGFLSFRRLDAFFIQMSPLARKLLPSSSGRNLKEETTNFLMYKLYLLINNNWLYSVSWMVCWKVFVLLCSIWFGPNNKCYRAFTIMWLMRKVSLLPRKDMNVGIPGPVSCRHVCLNLDFISSLNTNITRSWVGVNLLLDGHTITELVVTLPLYMWSQLLFKPIH